MSTAPAIREESTREAIAPPLQRFVFHHVTWPEFLAFLDWAGERHLRIAYDRGTLELMTTSDGHENFKRVLGRLVVALSEELDVPMSDFGSTTWLREDLDRGLEPDECFYIRNEGRVRGVMKLDLDRDPPPDLALEIDISNSSVDREGIYAALGVPELWRYDGDTLRVLLLDPAGGYVPSAASLAFPALPLDGFAEFIPRGRGANLTAWIKEFRAWVREHVLPLRPDGPEPEPRP